MQCTMIHDYIVCCYIVLYCIVLYHIMLYYITLLDPARVVRSACNGIPLEKPCVSHVRKHNSMRKRVYTRIMLPLMSQIWFHILGWG